MRKELRQAGAKAEFHPAFYYRDHSKEEILEMCEEKGPWGGFPVQHMATTISHASAWERFLATESTHCVIFEDDVYMSSELGGWLDDLSWWPNDADIVKIERWRSENTYVLLEGSGRNHKGREIQRLLTRHMGAAGYILTREAAQSLLDARPYNMVIDHLLFNFNISPVTRKMKIYQVLPALVEQGNEPEGSSLMGSHAKPKGMALLKQELKRGVLELALPLSTYWKFITTKAKLIKIEFKA